jgi:Type VII secretion system ESX-1, transport TM domain B
VIGSGLADGAGAPSAPPRGDAPGGTAVCTSYAAAGGQPPSLVLATPPPGSPPPLTTPGVTASPADASQIDVAPAGGALVRPQSAPGVGGTGYFLVTGEGVKFSVPAANVAALGYRTGSAAALPSSLLALLPTGPALDLQPMRR